MPIAKFRHHKVYYEFNNEGNGPVIVFLNGLIQNTAHWAGYAQHLSAHGIRSISFDQLGQGFSDRPVLDYDFEDNPDIVAAVLDACGVEKAYIAGISFGGTIVLKFGLKHPDRTAGLVPMSTFSELDSRLRMVGIAMWEGLARIGFEYLLDLFIPINFSHRFIDSVSGHLNAIRRNSFNNNDLYAIQNLIESLRNMPKEGFTAELHKITAPTLILNAEHDSLTPRWSHEVIRRNIANSRLMLIQHGFHAFSMEYPDITMRILREFITSVESGRWVGDQSVWIANDDANAEEYAFPCEGDHNRLIPIFKKPNASVTPVPPAPSDTPVKPAAKVSKPKTVKAAPVKTAAPPAGRTVKSATTPAAAVITKAPAKATPRKTTGTKPTTQPAPAKKPVAGKKLN